MLDKVINIVEIKNIGKTPLQVVVAPVDEKELLGTDVTPFDGSFFYDGEGLVKLLSGRTFIIEKYRVNLGQLDNYAKKGLAQVQFKERLLSEITDIS